MDAPTTFSATTSGATSDMDRTNSQTLAQINGQAVTPGHQGVETGGSDVRVIYCSNISTDLDYEEMYMIFKDYGVIERIKLRLSSNKKMFICYILFESNISASRACSMNGHLINDHAVEIKLCNTNKFCKEPHDFIPADLGYNAESLRVDRTPPTPIWYVATYREGRESIVDAAKCIQRKVGKIPFENMKRYGKNILIKANDESQAELLTKFKMPATGNVKSITPHKSFNTPKGVIYSRDLSVFSEEEILDMCPPNVYQVKRLRGANNAILLTFSSTYIPDYVCFDHLRVKVKRYRARPTQCYNCFEYGHIISRCSNLKKCNNCSEHHQEWSTCEQPPYCFLCAGNHSPTSKECPRKNFEQEVVDTAQNQHISIGSAKRQVMAANRDPSSSYALAIKKMKVPIQARKQIHERVLSNRNKETKQDSVPVLEASGHSTGSSDKALETVETRSPALVEDDLDSLPDLESNRPVVEDKQPSNHHTNDNPSITVETKSSVITVMKKNQKENLGFTTPSGKKRSRQTSPKNNSKIHTSNRFTALDDSPTSKKKAVSQEENACNSSALSRKQSSIKESGPKEQKSKILDTDQTTKDTVTKSAGTESKIPHLPNNPNKSIKKKLSTENFTQYAKEKSSQPVKDRDGNKS